MTPPVGAAEEDGQLNISRYERQHLQINVCDKRKTNTDNGAVVSILKTMPQASTTDQLMVRVQVSLEFLRCFQCLCNDGETAVKAFYGGVLR